MPTDVERYRDNFIDEINSAYLYRIAAEVEEDDRLSAVYARLAESEERHAALWEGKLTDAGAPVPDHQPELRSRILA